MRFQFLWRRKRSLCCVAAQRRSFPRFLKEVPSQLQQFHGDGGLVLAESGVIKFLLSPHTALSKLGVVFEVLLGRVLFGLCGLDLQFEFAQDRRVFVLNILSISKGFFETATCPRHRIDHHALPLIPHGGRKNFLGFGNGRIHISELLREFLI